MAHVTNSLSEQVSKKDDGNKQQLPRTRKSGNGGCFLRNDSQHFFEVAIELVDSNISYVMPSNAGRQAESLESDDIRDSHVKLGQRETCLLTSQVFYSIALN